jgi:LemA protein
MLTLIAIIAVAAVIVLWIISTQRKLVVLDENISNAMSQIGVQLSSRFDALTALLDLTEGYAKHESETLIETIKSRRSVITAKSTPDDVLRQEGIITEALGRIAMVAEQYPELKANQSYIKTMDAVQTYENMVRTSRLIYNDSVTKLNREIRMFPVSLIADAYLFIVFIIHAYIVLPVIVQILHFPAVHMGFAYFLTTSKGSFYRGPSLEIFQFGSDKSGSFSGLNMLKINHLVCCSVQFHRYPGFKIID